MLALRSEEASVEEEMSIRPADMATPQLPAPLPPAACLEEEPTAPEFWVVSNRNGLPSKRASFKEHQNVPEG